MTCLCYKHFPSSIILIVFAVLQTLAHIHHVTHGWTDYIWLMYSMTLSFLLYIENPAFFTIILLGSHLIMSNEYKVPLKIIFVRLFQLFIHISSHILHQTLLIFFHHGHNIGVLMTIIIQCLLVLCKFEAFLPRKLTCSWKVQTLFTSLQTDVRL